MEPSKYPSHDGSSPDQDLEPAQFLFKKPSSDSVLQWFPETKMEQRPLLKLRFINSPPPSIFTNSSIDAEDGSPIAIELVDATTDTRVTSHSLSFSRLEIVPVNADINEESWTTDEFNRMIVRQREGKRPLLDGDRTVTLKDGVGVMGGDVVFTDTSSWTRSGKFRLGARATAGGVVEAITNAFSCKDARGEEYHKHCPPYPDSEVWRLANIGKNGLIHSRLGQAGIHSVKDLRRYLSINSNGLHRILEGKISVKMWDAIVSHSMHCVLDKSECYIYNSKFHGAFILFNSVYEVIKVSFDGSTVLNTTDLTSIQQETLGMLKCEAYENVDSYVAADFRNFPPRSSPSLQDAELSICFSKSQGIIVDERSDFTELSGSDDVYEPLDTFVVSSASTDYDVVIRYRRGDVSNDGFISHLRAAFCRKGISVHEDFDEVYGVPECRVLILFLTSTYVTSNLLTILEHQQKEPRVVYPLFYGISPSDFISNSKNYERFFLQDEPKRWQAALKEIARMPHYMLTDKYVIHRFQLYEFCFSKGS